MSQEYYTIEKEHDEWCGVDSFNVYEHGEYDDSSVLSGQYRRSFIDSCDTLEEAKKKYPRAEITGCTKVELNLGYLPDENGNTYTVEGRDL